MSSVTGIFASAADAERAIDTLKAQGFEEGAINVLTRGESSFPVHEKQAGAAVGAAIGLSAVTFLPGLGPVIGLGMLASGLIGAGLGAAAGAAVQRHTHGIPNEDLFFFEEAIRDGRAVVIVDARDGHEETRARNLLERAGGRAVGATRRDWWQHVRQEESSYLRSRGQNLDHIEPDYKAGFEAALHPATRGREYQESVAYVETCYPEPCRTEAFRIGYDRGQNYFRRKMSAREME
jgi:hypothetical protein